MSPSTLQQVWGTYHMFVSITISIYLPSFNILNIFFFCCLFLSNGLYVLIYSLNSLISLKSFSLLNISIDLLLMYTFHAFKCDRRRFMFMFIVFDGRYILSIMMFLSIVSGGSLRDIAKTSNDVILRRLTFYLTFNSRSRAASSRRYTHILFCREAREIHLNTLNPFGDIWRSHQ